MTIVEIIQSMLSPGIMISACGLLLLGMNNKYSMVVNRIRVLDEEKRKLKQQAEEGNLNTFQEKRLNSINIQTQKLAFRIKLIRNAVIFYSIAVAFFILTCLTIGLNYIIGEINISGVVTILFLIGMLSVFTGILYASLEVIKGYQIIQVEIRES
jgi:hypothetical protein